MKVEAHHCFVCPLDGKLLAITDTAAQCASGHFFDRAREGYFNLLPVQHKASRQPGDDQTMVSARRRILDDGLFAPVAIVVFERLREYALEVRKWAPLRVVDAGCGEGYYLDYIVTAAAASSDTGSLEVAGYDISKWAVRAAARRNPDLAWAVASNRQPPFAANTIDLMLSLFGFPHWPAFEAVLMPRGRVLLVDAGAEHLIELRKLIYAQTEPTAPPLPRETVARGWRLVNEQAVEYQVQLNSTAQIQALLAMTPHGHRIAADRRAAMAQMHSAEVTISVVCRVLESPAMSPQC